MRLLELPKNFDQGQAHRSVGNMAYYIALSCYAESDTNNCDNGLAVAQAAARVRSQVKSCGVCGGQSGPGVGFLRVPRFALPILIPPTAPHSSSPTIGGWYNRPKERS
jgi:hypothetical protein